MNTLLLILVGMFVGWNIPQPTYAKMIQDWVMSKIRNFSKKDED